MHKFQFCLFKIAGHRPHAHILEMSTDPFLEAGIAIPAELPYNDDKLRETSARDVVGPNDPPEDTGLVSRLRKVSHAIQNRRRSSCASKIRYVAHVQLTLVTL